MKKYTKWHYEMIALGKKQKPEGWMETGTNNFTHKEGNTKIYKVLTGIKKGSWAIEMNFPEYHKQLATKGFKSRADALYFSRGYLIKFPYG